MGILPHKDFEAETYSNFWVFFLISRY